MSVAVQWWAHATYRWADPAQRMVGKRAPDSAITALDGSSISLDKFRGRLVILEFWASWCTPCREEFGVLERWRDEQRHTGLLDSVVVFSVNMGETREQVESFVRHNSVPFPILLDPDTSVSSRYGITSLPTIVLIEPKGRVAHTVTGFSPEIGETL
ncbi:MAG TPA: TlpA disulfide reductase family protein, partial [Candidatus Krumholzibacteria bacterium]|nr:TlpA disulfide reductase family protein [Candidatus Krumholzibacteria bacterium]